MIDLWLSLLTVVEKDFTRMAKAAGGSAEILNQFDMANLRESMRIIRAAD